MLRERESTRADFFVGLLDLRRLKWGSSVKHSVQDYPNRPVVNFVTMTTFGLKNFRSQIVRCATYCAFTLSLIENLGSEAEISNFQTHALG